MVSKGRVGGKWGGLSEPGLGREQAELAWGHLHSLCLQGAFYHTRQLPQVGAIRSCQTDTPSHTRECGDTHE